MNFIKTPTKGMRDLTPKEMELREYVLKVMKDTYENFGFQMIQTPVVEHIENLTNKQGGDNEKLIFKILKRGEKFDLENASEENDLVDSGLRYDLTVPLTRFYAGHMNELSNPFRALQIGNVYRADRPQKGRFREFMQCDLDIFGDKTSLAEVELITAVVSFLKKLDFKNFTIHINDRRILSKMTTYVGFKEEDLDSILISLDKLDKIGFDGVEAEMVDRGYDASIVKKYLSFFQNELSMKEFCEQFEMDSSIVDNLNDIMDSVSECVEVKLMFDPTLVRGMGYYTGPIFEIHADDLSSSMGGGGRYDKMVEKYANASVPACGFSVGFERLLLILEERGFEVPNEKEKIAYIINSDSDKKSVFKKAYEDRSNGKIVKVLNRSKNFKFQIETLEKDGYSWKEV